ncbi:MAG TPA: 50S ribosomal protein L4 [Candidatus Pacearchaeota archaeon]|nr:50S ribosomal protein L4 [Candidatus Pacearchaeota archaeon]HDZ60426.1 50S ribosomal protein L4 [Candidatus Pacearchaeota archaeon]
MKMKADILDITGKKKVSIELPKCFSQEIREDIVAKVLEAKKTKQPYSPSPVAGKQHSASGTLRHRRHVWKSSYGRGMSRIPRKAFSRRGSQFNWEGAEIPSTRGGRRAHPPKVLANINTLKINKKELMTALCSAISATADSRKVSKKYSKLKDKKLENLPFIVESKLTSLKTKQLVDNLKKILGEGLIDLAVKKRKVRSGRGKLRGRKYKKNAGLLLVTGKDEKLKTNVIEVKNTKMLGVQDLAKGGVGRLTLYTENAIKELGEKLK